MADEIHARIYDDRTREWVPLEVIMAEREAAKAQRQYLMTRVYVCDREGETEPKEITSLEIRKDDWAQIVLALARETSLKPSALAQDILTEILGYLPEGVE